MSWALRIEKALFYFFIFCWPLQLRHIWGGAAFNEWSSLSLYATDLLLAAIFILWAIRKTLSKKRESIFNVEDIALGFFLLFCALSLFAAAGEGLAFFRLIKLLEFIVLYFYVRSNFAALYSLKRFWQWFVAGAVAQSGVAIAQFLTQQSLGLTWLHESPLAPNFDGVAKIVVEGERIVRAYGLVPHPNILAAILVVAIFGAAWLWIKLNQESRIKNKALGIFHNSLFIILYSGLFSALFFTFSRAVIIVGAVLFLAWLAYLWLRNKEYRRQIIRVLILLLAISAVLLAVYWPYISARFDPGALPGSQALDLRSFYNWAALDTIRANPWLGTGLGNFTAALRQAVPGLPDWQYQPAHSLYLLAAAEAGLPALLAFLVFLFLTLKAAWRQRKDLGGGVLLFIVYCLLFIGLFDHFLWDLQQGQIFAWLMLGLLAGLNSKQHAEKI